MMEDHEFCDNCPGCRPAMLDLQTNEPVPHNDPKMHIVNRIWDNETTYAERKAFIEVTLKNSRLPNELKLAQRVINKLQEGLRQ
jgi:hypothetical protein